MTSKPNYTLAQDTELQASAIRHLTQVPCAFDDVLSGHILAGTKGRPPSDLAVRRRLKTKSNSLKIIQMGRDVLNTMSFKEILAAQVVSMKSFPDQSKLLLESHRDPVARGWAFWQAFRYAEEEDTEGVEHSSMMLAVLQILFDKAIVVRDGKCTVRHFLGCNPWTIGGINQVRAVMTAYEALDTGSTQTGESGFEPARCAEILWSTGMTADVVALIMDRVILSDNAKSTLFKVAVMGGAYDLSTLVDIVRGDRTPRYFVSTPVTRCEGAHADRTCAALLQLFPCMAPTQGQTFADMVDANSSKSMASFMAIEGTPLPTNQPRPTGYTCKQMGRVVFSLQEEMPTTGELCSTEELFAWLQKRGAVPKSIYIRRPSSGMEPTRYQGLTMWRVACANSDAEALEDASKLLSNALSLGRQQIGEWVCVETTLRLPLARRMLQIGGTVESAQARALSRAVPGAYYRRTATEVERILTDELMGLFTKSGVRVLGTNPTGSLTGILTYNSDVWMHRGTTEKRLYLDMPAARDSSVNWFKYKHSSHTDAHMLTLSISGATYTLEAMSDFKQPACPIAMSPIQKIGRMVLKDALVISMSDEDILTQLREYAVNIKTHRGSLASRLLEVLDVFGGQGGNEAVMTALLLLKCRGTWHSESIQIEGAKPKASCWIDVQVDRALVKIRVDSDAPAIQLSEEGELTPEILGIPSSCIVDIGFLQSGKNIRVTVEMITAMDQLCVPVAELVQAALAWIDKSETIGPAPWHVVSLGFGRSVQLDDCPQLLRDMLEYPTYVLHFCVDCGLPLKLASSVDTGRGSTCAKRKRETVVVR